MATRLLAATAIAAAGLLVPSARPAVAADPATIVTEAVYVVEPDAGRIGVSVSVIFTNTTPNPPGQFSVFDEVPLAVQDGASEVTARDASGALTVNVGRSSDVNVATIKLRNEVRYQQSASFTLEYRLADGAEASLRIRPSLVVFPAWGFGTSSSVRIEIPSGYEVRSDGDPLQAATSATSVVLTSGPIANPGRWVAVVSAARPAGYTTLRESVPLGGGTVDLQVRAWVDDPEWGERIRDLLVAALPRLEAASGFDYPGVGPLVVVEAATVPAGDLGEGSTAGQQIEVGYDAPDFTVLHQVAHVWIVPRLFADRWLREGLASHVASLAAGELEIERPFDPQARRTELAANAFPLADWAGASTDPAREGYGYAASWALVDALAERMGEPELQAALSRIAGGLGAYDSGPPVEPGRPSPNAPAVDSQRFLDQLERLTTAELGELFATEVFGPAEADLLAARAEARDAYDELVEAADGWGAPVPVRQAMAGWQFEAASAEISEAHQWLAERDVLRAEMANAELSMPARLRQRYEESGGRAAAWTELQAERAVVEDYRRVSAHVAEDRSAVAHLGLLGEPEPASLLTTAAGRFAEGDLSEAHAFIDRAGRAIETAEVAGIARLITVVVLLGTVSAGAILVARRRHRYTARP